MYGGVYIDVDYLCLKPLDDIITSCEFFAGVSNTSVLEINNGILGCRAGHPLMQKILASCRAELHKQAALQLVGHIVNIDGNRVLHVDITSPGISPPMATIAVTGPGMLTRAVYTYITSKAADPTFRIFPKTLFHPIPNHCSVDISDEQAMLAKIAYFARPESVAAHLWQKSWQ